MFRLYPLSLSLLLFLTGCESNAPLDASTSDVPGADVPGLDAPLADGAMLDGGRDGGGGDAGVSLLTLPDLPRLPAALGPRFPGGIEPGDPSVCEAVPPARCYWVDADAPAGGDGSFGAPASSFEAIVGYLNGTDYVQGTIASGDYLYLRGTFEVPAADDNGHLLRIMIRRASQTGTVELPTVIKSWRGSPRAVFDGLHHVNDMIVLANVTSVRVANLEIRNANGRGLVVESGSETAIFEDLVVHDTIGDGNLGVGGGLHFWGGAEHTLVVRHSHFYENDRDAFGAVNNIGAVSLTSDLEGPEHGSLQVYRNVFEDETTGVRHKHSGSYDTEIYENLFWRGGRGILLRSFRSNDIHHNVFLDLDESAIVSYVENTRGELMASIHHNEFYDTTRLLTDVIGLHDHDHHIDFHHNFFHASVGMLVVEASPTDTLPLLSGSHNLFVLPNADVFFRAVESGPTMSFADYATQTGDTTSRVHLTTITGSDEAAHRAVRDEVAAELAAGDIGL